MNVRTLVHGVSYVVVTIGALAAINYQKDVIVAKRSKAIPSFTGQYQDHGVPVETFNVEKQNVTFQKKLTVTPSGKRGFEALVDRETLKVTEIGRKVKVYNGDRIYRGQVSRVSNTLDLATGLYPIRIKSNDEIQSDWAWFEADLEIPFEKKEIVIPIEIVWSVDKKPYVWRIENGQAKRSDVELGYSDGYQAVVKSGVIAGDILIKSKTELLSDDVRVRIAQATGE
ncbi:hypothetical protein [Pseudobacteriovorax antillogorgiicola]|uniref:HlyD family secretion protein n=1 Tax=Pseudobacteriovorax antillogorgiicola TaxID=1513793 RepID=A0A1Y6BFP6_9BACT|nr:hypothetical protein [Pseudobacteriovorax antillogorgiicola]TCS57393.1 hypothetical protein EDD56_103133 [Pseudobacteriovorax antillogorgiicola]SMF01639.1 hypothetical protein SAMN06296036_103200 [Pseudobacteriovorax antillogorgiicola]